MSGDPLQEVREEPPAFLPGERNSSSSKLPRSFHPKSWWLSSFRVASASGGSFARFLRSFFRKSATSLNSESTAVCWPMPLPYPEAMKSGGSSDSLELSFRRAINLCVATLDWVHLRRPSCCPLEVVLHVPLNRIQWRVVRHISSTMTAWKEFEPVSVEQLGRAASKVESFEAALERLQSFESGVERLFEESQPDLSGPALSKPARGKFSPGLQSSSPGEVVGSLESSAEVVAKPIIADRIDFRGRPSFNPSPFLDEQGRFIFDRPLEAARSPSDSRIEPPPVKLFGQEAEIWKLFKKLDETGRLGIVKDTEVLPGLQAGLFAVGKDSSKDRLIFDSRPFNTLESPPARWVASMSSALNLTDIHLKENQDLTCSGTDLREFYYSFEVNHQRLIRNSLLYCTTVDKVSGFKCCTNDIRAHQGKVFLALRTLAMGDCCAVELAQTAHVGILYQLGVVTEENLMSMTKALPRGPKMIGVVIDDLICFEFVVSGSCQSHLTSGAEDDLRKALSRFEELGLTPHSGKTFFSQKKSEFWGAYLEGDSGFVRASLRRVFPVLFATIGIIRLGVCTISLLETIVGSWTSILLFRRRMLSLLQVCYAALQAGGHKRDVLRLSVELKEELLLLINLAPLAATFLRTKDSRFVYASDASSWGWAVVKAPLPLFLQDEIHRHRLRKSVWAKLLSPLKSLLRIKGLLPEADELPEGVPLPSHPLWIEMSRVLQFQFVKSKATPEGRHINIDELVGMIETERSAVLDEGFPIRCFGLADSQVGLGVLQKGRSSSVGLNAILQQSLPIHLGCGVTFSNGFLPSEFNPGDDRTRFAALRKPSKVPEPWMDESVPCPKEVRLAELDKWLEKYKCGPWDMSGLPSLQELGRPYVEERDWTKTGRFRGRFGTSTWGLSKRASSREESSGTTKSVDTSSVAEENVDQPSPRDSLACGDSGGASAVSSHVLDRWCMSSGESTCDPLPTSEPRNSFSAPQRNGCPFASPSRPILKKKGRPQIMPVGEMKGVAAEVEVPIPPGAVMLSPEAKLLLQEIPRKQFIFPKSWNVPDEWRPSFAGYVDLYSGKKGVARAVVEKGLGWGVTFEIEDDPSQDVMSSTNNRIIRSLVTLGAVHTLGAAIFCSSFSRAVRPPVRTSSNPEGVKGISMAMLQKVELGNRHCTWLAGILKLCKKHSVHFWVENPDISFLWWMPDFAFLSPRKASSCFRLDYCVCGTAWRKRTRIVTDLHLAGQVAFCNRLHTHRRLVGWSRIHGCAWTRAAQAYPKRLCFWLADAILIDAGLLPARRRLNVALLAKQTNGRIGEASNPGPRRRGSRVRRPLTQLLDVQLVEPTTALLGEKVWKAFRAWCELQLAPSAFDSLIRVPSLLSLLIESFGCHLFESGQSLYLLRQLITYVQRTFPQSRGSLFASWQLVSKWEQIQPLKHRTPLPLVMFRAMVVVGLQWQWFRWVGITLLAFEGICRPGEPLNATRGDLLLARDLVVENPASVFLRICNPKGRRRGIGAVQHCKIVNLQTSRYLDFAFGQLTSGTKLYAGSHSSYRKRWDEILKFLRVPPSTGLTPASLRSGGAIAAYRNDEEIARLLWKMRLRNIDTLQHYLQEVGAVSCFAELPSVSKGRIQDAALLFDLLMSTF